MRKMPYRTLSYCCTTGNRTLTANRCSNRVTTCTGVCPTSVPTVCASIKPASLSPLEQAIHLCDEQPDDFEQEFRKITTLLAAIPDEQAEVIRLRIHGDNSFTDIAAILELPVSTVKSRFQYGIEKIRKGIYAKSQTL